MARTRASVRDAVAADADALARLWADLLMVAGVPGRTSIPPSSSAVACRLEAIEGNLDRRLLVAVTPVDEGEIVVGAVYLAREPLTPLHDDFAVRASYLHVLADHRRRGIGRSLLDAAASWAVEIHAEHLVVDVNPNVRETNRFLARIGLRPLVGQRSVPVAALRRRIAGGPLIAPEVLGEPGRRLAAVHGRRQRPWRVVARG